LSKAATVFGPRSDAKADEGIDIAHATIVKAAERPITP
jgi:hypothetical protein